MKKTKAPKLTPSPKTIKSDQSHMVGDKNIQSALFISLTLDMTWRMVIVILIPLLLGYLLDKGIHTTPLFTVLGLIIALISMTLVLKRTLKIINSKNIPTNGSQS